MPYTTINKSTAHFNTKLYTGNGTDNTAITGLDFQPDLNWTKQRSGTEWHSFTDSVRGVTKQIFSNSSQAEQTNSTIIKSFDSNGFTVGTNGATNSNGSTYVSWNWKAGTTSSISGGSITPSSVSINTTSGFGIYKWTGTGSTGTIAHGLGAVPKLMFIKNLSSAESWRTYHHSLGNATSLKLNTSDTSFSDTGAFNSTTPTSTLFTVGNSDSTNKSGDSFVAYVFAEITGYSKFGKYYGTNSTDGAFLYTGFKPAVMILKRLDVQSNSWLILDNKRDPDNLVENYLFPSETDAEGDGGGSAGWDFLSNGIKQRNTYGSANQNSNYLFIAFAEAPLVGSNNVPCTAR